MFAAAVNSNGTTATNIQKAFIHRSSGHENMCIACQAPFNSGWLSVTVGFPDVLAATSGCI